MKVRLVKSQYVSVADIQAECLPVRMIGNRIFVERKVLKELLASENGQRLALS